MASCWSIPGVTQRTPSLAEVAAAAAITAASPRYEQIQCPACKESERIRIRTSDEHCTRMLCHNCGHTWKVLGEIRRVLVVVAGSART